MSYPHVMAIESILAQLDAEIARLTQVRALLASSGKVAAKVTERKSRSGRRQDAEKARTQRRGAQAHCGCAAQAVGCAESQIRSRYRDQQSGSADSHRATLRLTDRLHEAGRRSNLAHSRAVSLSSASVIQASFSICARDLHAAGSTASAYQVSTARTLGGPEWPWITCVSITASMFFLSQSAGALRAASPDTRGCTGFPPLLPCLLLRCRRR